VDPDPNPDPQHCPVVFRIRDDFPDIKRDRPSFLSFFSVKTYLLVHKNFTGLNSDRDLATLFCVPEKFLLTAGWRLPGTLYIEGGGAGVSDFVTSLAKGCTP
jgi:hypothetical protein